MARKTSTRVVLNRSRVDRVHLAFATGVYQVAKEILRATDAPDATPWGTGLVTNGGALLYRGRNKLAGVGLDGRQPRPPRAAKVSANPDLIQAIVGYGFPGRFQEFGTVRQPARPFLTPAAQQVIPNAGPIMASVVRPALAKMP
jgi:HK97 gp10 family phage protein